MRPPEFTGGNAKHVALHGVDHPQASMRPPEFTGGNMAVPISARPPGVALQ